LGIRFRVPVFLAHQVYLFYCLIVWGLMFCQVVKLDVLISQCDKRKNRATPKEAFLN